jgi:hypothetical protein
MRVLVAAIIFTSTGLVSCTSLPIAADEMCAPVLDFAGSVGPDDVRSIAFHTSWGGNFRDDPEPVIYAKRCVHEDYEPAKAVCRFFLERGATEFSGNNVQRVLSCLAPETNFGPNIQLNEGQFSVRFGTPDRGSHITVQYGEDVEIGGMVLRIKADGY